MAKRAARGNKRAPKTKPDAPGAKALIGHNKGPEERSEDEIRALFLKHRSPWNAAQAALTAAKKRLQTVVAELRNDGFTKKQYELADDLGTVSGEAKITGEIADRLKVARWMGHPLGAQLDLFNEPDRTPITERAYEAGKTASMEDQPRKPPHAPQTEAYSSWMEGYDAHQRDLAGGFKAPPKRKASDELAERAGETEPSQVH